MTTWESGHFACSYCLLDSLPYLCLTSSLSNLQKFTCCPHLLQSTVWSNFFTSYHHSLPPAGAPVPATSTESVSSQLSTQSFREIHGYPIAVARRMNHPANRVWVSQSGRCFHRLRCFKLDGCDRVKSYERHDAESRGLRACKKCNP